MRTARAVAVANENRTIDESQGRAIAAAEQRDKPKNALQALSQRYGMSTGKLVETLRSTVFSAARNEAEFNALIVVANEYKLNPLLKEIYAFPAKGQGIVPMVSVDGWIRIMNEHPDFDGIEFVYHADEKGDIEAIESIIHHKRRAHPIQTTEFMVECKRDSEPWRKSPRRMLRHRALMQGARIAFGFAGIYVEDDVVIEGEFSDRTAPSLPPAQQWEEYDEETGEVVEDAETEDYQTDSRGMTEVDEETARALDQGKPEAETGEAYNDTPEEQDRAEETVKQVEEKPKAQRSKPAQELSLADDIRRRIDTAQDMAALSEAHNLFSESKPELTDGEIKDIRGRLADKRNELA